MPAKLKPLFFASKWYPLYAGAATLFLVMIIAPVSPADRITVSVILSVFAVAALCYGRLLFDDRKSCAVMAALIVAALLIRVLCFTYQSADYNNFLKPWVDEFKTNGGLAALKSTTSNYNLPYLYFLALISVLPVSDLFAIKLFSVAFDLVVAFTLCSMVESRKNALLCLAAVLFWPTFLLNSAYWAQCDSIYAAFCLLSFACAIKKRPKASVLYAGLAFAFKLQAVFYLPVFLILLLAKRVKLWHALLFPIPYLLTALPAIGYGWTFARIIKVYTGQVDIYSDYLTLNAPSIFAFWPLGTPKQPLFNVGLALAALFIVSLAVFAYVHRKSLDKYTILGLAAVITLGLPWLLPSMHERYFYLAEAFTLLYVSSVKRKWHLAALVLFGSAGGYYAYLVESRLSDKLWPNAAAFLLALVLLCFELVRRTGRGDVSIDKEPTT